MKRYNLFSFDDAEEACKSLLRNFKRLTHQPLADALIGKQFKSASELSRYLKTVIPRSIKERLIWFGYNASEIKVYTNSEKARCEKINKTKLEKYGNHWASSRFCVEYWITRGYSESDAAEEIKKLQSGLSKKVKNRNILPNQILYWTNRGYSIDEAKINVSNFNKIASPRNVEHWLNKGYTKEEALLEISNLQKLYSNKQLEIYTDDERRRYNRLCDEYWENKGFSHEEIKQIKIQNGHTFSLRKLIKKHGEEEGVKIWNDRQQKWLLSLRSKSREELENIQRRKGVSYKGKKKESLFYIIKIDHNRTKIGITNHENLHRRYYYGIEEDYECTIIQLPNIKTAYIIEQEMLNEFKNNIFHQDTSEIPFGWTEIINNVEHAEIINRVYEKIKTFRN